MSLILLYYIQSVEMISIRGIRRHYNFKIVSSLEGEAYSKVDNFFRVLILQCTYFGGILYKVWRYII